MPSIFTLEEALSCLSQHTGVVWNDSAVFDLVVRENLPLRAVIPANIATVIQEFELGGGLVEKMRLPPGHALMAVVFPFQTAELWQRGETSTSHPADHDQIEGQYKFTTEPVRVTKDNLRFKAETLATILRIVSDPKLGIETPLIALGTVNEDLEAGKILDSNKERDEVAFVPRAPAGCGLETLFDPVTLAALEKMFPANGAWNGWANRAARNGLESARVGRGMFNPFFASEWFLKQGRQGWDRARCDRVLANNLPHRSRDQSHLFTGE